MTRPLEEAYFAQVNAARRQQIREELAISAYESARAEGVKRAVLTDDDALVRRLRALGFDEDSVRVIDLLPLIVVSWADGRVQREERVAILELLSHRGIDYDSEAWMLIESLLEQKPNDAYLDEALAVIKALRTQHDTGSADIVQLCHSVANASGGLLGLKTISAAEREALHRVAAVLGDEAIQKFHALLG